MCAATSLAPFTSNRRHMRAIPAHHFAPFTSGATRLLRGKFVRSPLRVRRLPPLAGKFTLFRLIHRCKTAEGSVLVGLVGHRLSPFSPDSEEDPHFRARRCTECLEKRHRVHWGNSMCGS